MKLLIRCPSGLHIEFEGGWADLPHLDRFLGEIASVETQRLELRHQLDIAERRAAVPFEPFPDPSPPSDPAPAAEPADEGRPDDPQPPARITAPRAGGTGDLLDADRVLAALDELGEATVAEIRDRAGLTGKSSEAVRMTLVRLRDQGRVAHNGQPTIRGRWLRVAPPAARVGTNATGANDPPAAAIRKQLPTDQAVIGVAARAQMDEQLAERHDAHRGQILNLVAEHGPVAPAWIADQLVKNRRDTAALMREMVQAGQLIETDASGYYDIPDRDDHELAA